LILVETIEDCPTNASVACPQHRPIKELAAHSAAAPLPIYAEGEFREIVVARTHDVRGSHDIEVIIEQRQDVIGAQINALQVLADAGIADGNAETHTTVRSIQAEEVLKVLRQLTDRKRSNEKAHTRFA
jgi:hypothetical protein